MQAATMNSQQPLWWIKLTRFEFWPYWVFYFPCLFYGLYLALKSGSLTYFTAVNPGMKAGGLVGEGKMNMLQKIDPQYLPRTLHIHPADQPNKELLLLELQEAGIPFPFVIKPNTSERGIGVEKITDATMFFQYLTTHFGDFVVQEFIDWDIELGVLYHRFPNGTSGISSIVQKEFLMLRGDGKSTLKQLMHANVRARFRLTYLFQKFDKHLEHVLPTGERMLLEPIGNHNRGTAFINANQLNTKELIEVFNAISQPMDGFYYGRFDIKVKSFSDLQAGKNIRIMEVNGVESEPAHIYDPAMPILEAYKVVSQHMDLIYRLSKANRRLGAINYSFINFIKELKEHFAKRALYRVQN